MAFTNVAHYVGLTIPRCQRTYGVSPCQAQLSTRADGSEPNAIYSAGAYARRAAGLSGAADSGMGMGSFWIFPSSLSGNQTFFAGVTTLGGATARFTIRMVNTTMRIVGVNSAGTTVLDIRASSIPLGSWSHIMYSFDLSTAGRRHIYVDGISNLSQTTFTVGGTIDYTLADWSFGALANGSEGFADNEGFAEFWFASGQYLDLSVQGNRDKFFLNSRPVELGATGNIPTGTGAIVFFRNRVEDGWADNEGTGGGFGTIVGGGDEENIEFGTGTNKCFNTLATCQDPENYLEESPLQVMYFGEDTNQPVLTRFLDPDATIYPFIKDIDFDSAIVSLGENMGQRGQITVTMRDGLHNDLPTSLFDKYASERDYDAFTQGSFWGKFRARNRFLRFQPLYLFTCARDDNGDIESTIEARTYLIESVTGPENGEFKIIAKDTLKVADGDYATAPVASPGYLSGDITDVATTATIIPSGTLAADYPSSGLACIGGNEIVIYTQTGGDNVSLTRGQFGTTAVEHSTQDRFQVCWFQETPESPEVIIADLLENYAGIDPSLVPFDDWSAEIAANLGTVYQFVVTEPTPVNKLVSEIIQQIGGAIWWDDVGGQIRLQILREIQADAERWNEDNTLAHTLDVTEQESKRVTQVQVYYAQINPTLKVDETRNYASVFTVTDEVTEILVGGRSLKQIFARGISSGGQAVAEVLANKWLGRYVNPPRRFSFQLLKYSGVSPALGGGYLLGGGSLFNPLLNAGSNQQGLWPFQDEFGARVEIPIQVTRVNPVGNVFEVEAEEMLFSPFGTAIDPHNHTIIFDVSRNNVNLQETHDSVYAEALSGDTVNCYVNGGVYIGSDDVDVPAFVVGSFNSGVVVNIFVNGRIQGKGGHGGNGTLSGENGQYGGTALYTRQAINLDNQSQIWGGAGGGGASAGVGGGGTFVNSGGGGAGTEPGAGGLTIVAATYHNPGAAGTQDAGGAAPFSPVGGNGGNPGQAGQNASGGSIYNTSGGAAGNAVDGTSFVTYVNSGDIQGPQVN